MHVCDVEVRILNGAGVLRDQWVLFCLLAVLYFVFYVVQKGPVYITFNGTSNMAFLP